MEKRTLSNLVKDDEGLSTVEYIIILVLIAVIGIVAWQSFGQSVKTQVQGATSQIDGLGMS